ncbi:ice-binding family protein [Polaribacter glomeratus]|uniref:Antifreeze protein n=1 Tax=Polaribacter glomeratus TaxID=102 RepID=A0A2S7WVE7_9FLAO|nr:ice-binding family protein [Polaribacter glomeratus]PQJ81272.1 hypothetical protein BTO16_01145 [Polaribacter glomeratus]TXD65826.1 DUF3494 domain-containing protein [Polaribacter glomeratus]
MKIKIIFLSLVIICIAFFTSCAEDDFVEVDGLCPVVIPVNPLDGAINVPLNKIIIAKFNEKMNVSTISKTSFTLETAGVIIDGTVTYSDTDSTAIFTPSSLLISQTVYTARVKRAAKDLTGNALQEDLVWSFTTVPPLPKVTVAVISNPTIGGSSTIGGSTSTSALFDVGTNVTVTATAANPGYSFVNWTVAGVQMSTNSNYTFELKANTNLVANFRAIVTGGFILNVVAQNGTVLRNPDKTSYNNGDSVLLTATPNSNYSFTSWSDDASGNNSTVTVIMNSNKNVTANFANTGVIVGPGVINLGKAGDFVLLSKTGISTTGTTQVNGNVGVSPNGQTGLTGFSQTIDASGEFSTSSFVSGKIYAADYAPPTPAYVSTAISDQETAFTTANGLTTNVIVDLGAGNISGRTLTPGLYKWGTGLLITNQGVTLSGGPNDTWVFQISADFTIENNAKILLSGGAQAKNIFWITQTQALLGSNVDFKGNVIAKTLISVNTGTNVLGILLSQTAITLNASTIVKP